MQKKIKWKIPVISASAAAGGCWRSRLQCTTVADRSSVSIRPLSIIVTQLMMFLQLTARSCDDNCRRRASQLN